MRDLWNATSMLSNTLPLWVGNKLRTTQQKTSFLDLLPKDWSRSQLKHLSLSKHPRTSYNVTECFHTPNLQPFQAWWRWTNKRSKWADFVLLESWVPPLTGGIKLLFLVLEDKGSGFRNHATFSYGKSCQQLRHKNCSSQACGQS